MTASNPDRHKLAATSGADSDGDYELAPLDDERTSQPAPQARHIEEDDDAELELEPIDPEILAGEKRRAAEAVEAATKASNIDQIYRDAEPLREFEIPKDLADKFRFQFQLKHLLIATAALAFLLTLYQLHVLWTTLVIAFMLAVFVATAYVEWVERKRQANADRKRHEMYAARRAQAASNLGRQPAATESTSITTSPSLDGERVAPTSLRSQRRFQFTLGQLFTAITIAAILLAIIIALGGPQPAAVFFGMLALGGIVYHALGFEVPEVVAFAWFVMLVLYVLLSISAAVWTAIHGA
jgi:hypothetical protein